MDEDQYDIITPELPKGGRLTEAEILGCLKENLKLAAEHADKLAAGERGPLYLQLRDELTLVYGCCRQMAGWREDTRWSPFGVKIKEAQERCGRWLREKQPAWRFKSLAEILRFALAQALDLERKKTGRVGIILPEMLAAPTRTEGRPVSVILPPGFKRAQKDAVH